MRLALILAFCALGWTQPAQAQTFFAFTVEGYVPVTARTSWGSNWATWPEHCLGQAICYPEEEQYLQHVNWTPARGWTFNGEDFGFYSRDDRTEIYGTARSLGLGAYQGLSLTYSFSPLGVGDGPWTEVMGETNRFAIYQIYPSAVPEPATWALMLFGFAAVGSAMRRRQRVSVRPEQRA